MPDKDTLAYLTFFSFYSVTTLFFLDFVSARGFSANVSETKIVRCLALVSPLPHVWLCVTFSVSLLTAVQMLPVEPALVSQGRKKPERESGGSRDSSNSNVLFAALCSSWSVIGLVL